MKRTFLVVVAATALLSPMVQALAAPVSGASVVAAGVTRATFTSGTSATFVEGTSGTFRIAVAKGPVVFSFVGKLPLGLALVPAGDGLTAALSGTPEVGSAGTYAVKLTASNEAGATTQKLTLHVGAIGASVPVVTGVFGSGLAGSTLKIEGKNLAGALQVHVGSGLATIETDTASTVAARVPALPNGLVSVRVTTKAGTSPLSFEDLLDVQSVPASPTLTSATASGLGVVVEWRQAAAADEVTSYELTAAVDPAYGGVVPTGCSTPPAVALGARALAGEITGCAGIPYDVSVVAENAAGSSPAAVTAAETPLDAQVPGPPVLMGVGGEPGALDVQWAAPDDDGGSSLTGFVVTVSVGGTQVAQTTVGPSAVSATVGGLTNFTTYSVSVVATNAQGDSTEATGSGIPSTWNTPGAPGDLEVLPRSDGTSLSVSWSAPTSSGSDPLSGYVLQYGPSSAVDAACTGDTTGTLAKGWKSGAALAVKLPACAIGVTRATINGVAYPALELTTKSLRLTSAPSRVVHEVSMARGVDALSAAGAAFTQLDVGHPVTGAGIPASTVITAVSSPTSAYLSKAPTLTTTSGQVTVGGGSNPAVGTGATVLLSVATTSPSATKTIVLGPTSTTATLSGLVGTDAYVVTLQAESKVGGGDVLTSTAVSPLVKLTKGTVLLGTSTAASLLAVYTDGNGGRLLAWPSTAPATVRGLTPGEIVVLAGGSVATGGPGMVVTVQSVSRGPSGDYLVDTAPAEMLQAFSSFSYSYQGNPTAAGGPTSYARSHASAASRSVDPSFNWSNGTSHVSGQINVTPNLYASASVHLFSASMTVGASVTATESVSGYLDGSTSISLGTIPIFDIAFAVGPIPVELTVDIEPEIDLSGNVTFTEAASATVGGSLTLSTSNGLSTQNYSSASVSGTPTISGSGSAELSVPVDACLYVDVLCGDVGGTATLNVTAYSSGNPYYVRICPTLGLEIGYSVDFLWWSKSGSHTVASLNLPCWQDPAVGTQYEVAFESGSPTSDLQTLGSFGTGTQQTDLSPGTHPGIASLISGGYEAAYQNTSHLLVSFGATGTLQWGLGMMPGTSPSISGLSGGGYVIAFEANTGYLYVCTVNASGQTSVINTGQGMNNAATNPAVAGTSNGGWAVAFQANTTTLFLASYNGSLSISNTGDGMQTTSSPSIVALPQGGFEAAMAANTGQLLTRGSSWVAWGDGVSTGTTPSIIDQGSSVAVIFQASGSNDLYYAWTGPISTPIPMVAGTSPAAVGLSSGGYEAAYVGVSSGDVIQTLGGLGSSTSPGPADAGPGAAPSIMHQ